MKSQFVGSLHDGQNVDSVFALRSRESRATRAGDTFLALELADRSGSMPAVMFRPTQVAQSVPSGTVVAIKGVVTRYRGVQRVLVKAMEPVDDYDRTDLIPGTTRDTHELLAELRSLIHSVEDPLLARVLRAVFRDKEFVNRFTQCPGSISRHHAYIGGLLEHTVSVATMCRHVATLYPDLDVDLLVTGAILHDIGKVDEIAFDTAIEMTSTGRLIGHVLLGERRVRDVLLSFGPDVPALRADRLAHVLLSHHGEREWGAAVQPSMFEAVVLHHVDELDANAAAFVDVVRAAARLDEEWTDASNQFERALSVPSPSPVSGGAAHAAVVSLRRGA
ncbi:MAG: HD domain-containing protein [Actinomycetia bacterium]|nr:HD domain-containing protein [Actinomycetes bacterium]